MTEELKPQTVWYCKIGVLDSVALPSAADGPMREAVFDAFMRLTGRDAKFCFSGWGQTLDECELAVVENRMPRESATIANPDALREVVEALRAANAAINSAMAQVDAEWRNHDKQADKHDKTVREFREKARAALAKLDAKP